MKFKVLLQGNFYLIDVYIDHEELNLFKSPEKTKMIMNDGILIV